MLGFAIRTIREARGMSKSDLCEAASPCDVRVLNTIENETCTPSLELCNRIATALNIQPRELMWFYDQTGKPTKLNRMVRDHYNTGVEIRECLKSGK